MEKYVGKKVVVRAEKAGVFFGTLEKKDDNNVIMRDVRKLWYWAGACGVEELAVTGTAKPDDCKFTVIVPSMEIADAIQIIPCSTESIESIEGVKPWKA